MGCADCKRQNAQYAKSAVAARALTSTSPCKVARPSAAAFSVIVPLVFCPEMTMDEAMAADYAGTSLSTGPHPIAFAREALDRQGVTPAAAVGEIPNGHRVRVAGVVIVRQRPGTAKGFVFITVEDETGFANAIVTPQRFLAHRRAIVGAHALVIEGVVQNQQGVVSIKADGFAPLTGSAGSIDVSHDFH